MKLDIWLKKIRSCIVLEDAITKKTLSRTNSFVFTFSAVVVLPTDCILSFLFRAETYVLVPVLSRSTDVVVVNFVVFLKFPIIECTKTLDNPSIALFLDFSFTV